MTQPQETLELPGSDRGGVGLASFEGAVFDRERARASIDRKAGPTADAAAIRDASVAVLRDALKDGRAFIAEHLRLDPMAAFAAHSAYAYLTDCVVETALDIATRRLHPAPRAHCGREIVAGRRRRLWARENGAVLRCRSVVSNAV